MVDGVAVVTDKKSDVGDCLTVASSEGNSAAVFRVAIKSEERCWHSCNR